LYVIPLEKPEYTEHIKNIFDSVYWKLNNHLKDCENEECILERLAALKDKRVACLEGHIVTPNQIAENLIGNCSPYLYKMSRSLQNYKALWRHRLFSFQYTLSKIFFICSVYSGFSLPRISSCVSASSIVTFFTSIT
jgi:hypothetical protein